MGPLTLEDLRLIMKAISESSDPEVKRLQAKISIMIEVKSSPMEALDG
jgi:hypothetical protein